MRAILGALFKNILYPYTSAQKIMFKQTNKNKSNCQRRNFGGQLDYCVAN